jgi:hypothetical protein
LELIAQIIVNDIIIFVINLLRLECVDLPVIEILWRLVVDCEIRLIVLASIKTGVVVNDLLAVRVLRVVWLINFVLLWRLHIKVEYL